jgi:D-glycero-beta-D-manno-heptose-7-phosphate kinase
MILPRDQQVATDFATKKVLLIGDAMIDAYLWGASNRMSPEAPVPVIDVHKKESRLGGAANVALNLKTLGAQVLLVTAIGQDAAGIQLQDMLVAGEFDDRGIFSDADRVTSVKTRIISNNRHVLRVDEEVVKPVSKPDAFLKHIEWCMHLQKWDVLLLQDYDKGVLDEVTIPHILDLAHQKDIPVVVDPKKKNFLRYKRVRLFKPNLKELEAGLGICVDPTSTSSIQHSLKELRSQLESDAVLVTLSEHGVAFFDGTLFWQPAYKRHIVDVSGAGDTVISIAALAIASGYDSKTIAALANLAGGLVCEHAGVVPITLPLLKPHLQNS